ncbi:hypothetical protein [Hyphomonas sp.]|uniref:hypothetical protein n=1 Tax=Hyphomonas sp. TaxID=87 RepID=UPI0025C071AB|nr:hypothetical protein [Hyphomonas sp.]
MLRKLACAAAAVLCLTVAAAAAVTADAEDLRVVSWEGGATAIVKTQDRVGDAFRLAQAEGPLVEPVPVEAESTIPNPDEIRSWGDLVTWLGGYIEEIVLVFIAFGIRLLPGQLYAILVTARWEQIAANAIRFGINRVAGTLADKPIVDSAQGQSVLNQALVFALQYGPGFLIKWVGGPKAVAEKLAARLNLDADVDVDPAQAVRAARTIGVI